MGKLAVLALAPVFCDGTVASAKTLTQISKIDKGLVYKNNLLSRDNGLNLGTQQAKGLAQTADKSFENRGPHPPTAAASRSAAVLR